MEYNKILLISMDKVPKFRQEYRPKCQPIPQDSKTAKTDISAEISADTDTETDNFLSLVAIKKVLALISFMCEKHVGLNISCHSAFFGLSVLPVSNLTKFRKYS